MCTELRLQPLSKYSEPGVTFPKGGHCKVEVRKSTARVYTKQEKCCETLTDRYLTHIKRMFRMCRLCLACFRVCHPEKYWNLRFTRCMPSPFRHHVIYSVYRLHLQLGMKFQYIQYKRLNHTLRFLI